MSETHDLLLEIGCEELPASFVAAALAALPVLARDKLTELRLGHGTIEALGTPRRLALIVRDLASRQEDLAAEVTGPPVKAAFKDGAPTKAAEAFAHKLGCSVAELRRVETAKGEYLVGTRRETGQGAAGLLPGALASVVTAIPFRKSMRWGAGDIAFGRPIQWLVALLGDRLLPLELAGIHAGRATRGHRFLAPGNLELRSAAEYTSALRAAHVLVDPKERAEAMKRALEEAARQAAGALIEDDFLVRENVSLVEEPHVVAGGYADEFLELPERVILEVARGHQRYFGVRGPTGKLLPRYLAVVNTAENPDNVRRGNDRVMRARLADARFFYLEDLRIPLAARRSKLAGIVFSKRLGTVLAKAQRVERLARELGLLLMLPEPTLMAAAGGAYLAKCDLVSLMVGEFPELQGEMGRAYALAQGVDEASADVIRDHYSPRGASDGTAPTDAAALVAIADRLDTLVGCFAVGLTPTGAADPYGLRRACLGTLRTVLDRGFDLQLSDAFRAAYDGYGDAVRGGAEARGEPPPDAVKLDLGRDELVGKLGEFFSERLRGLLSDTLPSDAVAASIAIAADRPIDARTRAGAIAELDAATRAGVGEVFKRATNIASTAPAGEPTAPPAGAHATEVELHAGYVKLRERLASMARAGEHASAFREVAAFAPLLARYFTDVFVMDPDQAIRENRLRQMRAISETCGTLARLELLGEG
jgi:glycyl-tRNA synthetase beta chain